MAIVRDTIVPSQNRVFSLCRIFIFYSKESIVNVILHDGG